MHVKRTATILNPDQSRVLLRPFSPGGPERVAGIVARIMALPEDQVGPILDGIHAEFCERHHEISKVFRERFDQVSESLPAREAMSEPRRLLIGSYFLAEYSLESAALFNPSIVPHTDQTDLAPELCDLFSACAPPGKGTFRPSLFGPVSSIPISESRYLHPLASSPSRTKSQIHCMRRRCSKGNSLNWG